MVWEHAHSQLNMSSILEPLFKQVQPRTLLHAVDHCQGGSLVSSTEATSSTLLGSNQSSPACTSVLRGLPAVGPVLVQSPV